MKQKFFYFCFLLCSGFNLLAQSYIGIRGGGNAHQLLGDIPIYQKLSYGYDAGLVFRHHDNRNLGFQFEINYTERGWHETIQDTIDCYSVNNKYFEVPFLAHISFGQKGIKLFFNLGPDLAYLWKTEKTYYNKPIVYENLEFYKARIDKFQYGFTFGTGLKYEFSFGNFIIEARYSHHWNDVFKLPDVSRYSYVMQQSLSLTASFLVRISKPKSDKIQNTGN